LTSSSKKSRLAREASPEERAAFGEKQMILPAARLWSLDAFGVHLAISRMRLAENAP